MTRQFGNSEGNRVLNQLVHIFTKLNLVVVVLFFLFFLFFFPAAVNACTTAYYLKEHPSKRLFGLHVEEMDPTSCAIELSGCKRFSFVRS